MKAENKLFVARRRALSTRKKGKWRDVIPPYGVLGCHRVRREPIALICSRSIFETLKEAEEKLKTAENSKSRNKGTGFRVGARNDKHLLRWIGDMLKTCLAKVV